MNKIQAIAGAAALLACGASTAIAASPTITAGLYTGTTQFQSINDPAGLCATNHLVSVGEVQKSQGAFALGNAPVVITPLPDPTGTTSGGVTTYAGVGAQVCTYTPLPTALAHGGVTQVTGTTSCSAPGQPPVQIVTGTPVFGITGTSAIESVNKTTQSFKIVTSNAALEAYITVPPATTPSFVPLCFISTDQLFARTGK